MEQLSQQQSIYNQIGKLTVRFLISHDLDPSVDVGPPVPQVFLRRAPKITRGTAARVCCDTCLMREQRSPTTKAKIERVFARLDRLDLGDDDEDVVGMQESMRRVDLFT